MHCPAFRMFFGRARSAFFLSLFFGVLAQFAVCQRDGSLAPGESSQGSYTVSGSVLNSVTGEPIRRAAVQLGGATPRMTLTDPSGHFEFDGVTQERAYLLVSKPGFSDGQSEISGRVAVTVNRTSSPLLLRMSPTNTIFGKVTASNQQPLEGFIVRVVGKGVVDGRLNWIPTGLYQAQTNEDGEFRIYGLPAGSYYLAVNQQNRGTTLSQAGVPNAREQTYSTVYYPGVADVSAATPFQLAFGQEVEANFTLTPEPLYDISGSLAVDSNAFPQFAVTRNVGEQSDFLENVSLSEGKFQTKLPAGSYTVSGSRPDGVSLSASLIVTSDAHDLSLVLVPAPSVEVRVRTESVAGPPPQQVPGANGPMGMMIQLVSTSSFDRSTAWWDARSETIRNIQPGVFRARIIAPAPWWVKSARSGGTDLLTDDLTIPASGAVPPIEVTLQDGAGNIQGTVTPADDPQAATVLLVQHRGDRNLIQAIPSVSGNFAFQSVAPGEYALLAFLTAEQIEYENPEVLDPYLSSAPHISVQASTTTTVSVSRSASKR